MLRHRYLPAVALALLPFSVSAATLAVEVRGQDGAPIPGAVVYALPIGRKLPAPAKVAVMTQRNGAFVPRILAVQTGTAVSFPAGVAERHQIYSDSAAKTFRVTLYAGLPAAPIVFDKPGAVSLRCSLDQAMRAWVVVLDTPFFALVEDGRASLPNLPVGSYDIRVWHEGAEEGAPAGTVTLAAGETRAMTCELGSK